MRTVLGSKFLKVSAAVFCTVALFCCAIFCCLNLFDDKNTQTANAEVVETVEEDTGEPTALAEDMETVWNNAVNQSKSTNSRVTVTLNADWNADPTTHKFGSGINFSNGRLTVPSGADIVMDLNGYNINYGLTEARTGGGTIYVQSGTLTLKDTVGSGSITGGYDNHTAGGGGIVITNGGTLYTSVKISNNTAKYGGGISANNSTVYITGGSISENTATDSASGGIYLNASSLYLNGGTVSYNNGGIHATKKSYIEINGGKVTNNKHLTTGGIYLDDSTLVMNSGDVSYNQNLVSGASNNAGGITAYNGSQFTMNGGTISGNIYNTRNSGAFVAGAGGVLVKGKNTDGVISTFKMYGGTISGNDTASHGGALGIWDGRFELYDGTISGNTHSLNADGWSASAIFVGSSTTHATFTEETADFVMWGGSISSNKSEQVGALHTTDNAYLIMYDGEWVSNTGTESGGAILLWQQGSGVNLGARLDMYGGSFRKNFSNYNGGGAIGVGQYCTLNMYGGEIVNNYSLWGGGGIYARYASATINLFGGVITGNEANYNNNTSKYTYKNDAGEDVTVDVPNTGYLGGGVFYNNCNFTVGGSIQIYDNYNGHFSRGAGRLRDDVYIANSWTNKIKLSNDHPLTSARIFVKNDYEPTLTEAAASTATGAVNFVSNATATTLSGNDVKTYFSSHGSILPVKSVSYTVVMATSGDTVQLIKPLVGYGGWLYWRINDGSSYIFSSQAGYYNMPYSGKTLTVIASATNTGTTNVATVTASATVIKNVGVYTFTMNNNGSTMYYNPVFTLTIEQVELDVSWSSNAFTYSGANVCPTPTVVGAVNGEKPVISLNKPAASADVGTYTASVSLTNAAVNNNYTLNLGNSNVTYSVAAATLSKPYSGGTMTYSGAAQLLLGGFNATSMTVSFDAASPAQKDTIYGVNAGTYTATVRLSNTKNYRWEDGTTSAVYITTYINKATLSVSGITLQSRPYDGTPNVTLSMDISVLGVMPADYNGADVDQTKIWVEPVGATSGSIALTGSDVGQYTKVISLQLTGSLKENYQLYSGEYECVCNITKAQIEITGGIAVATVGGLAGKTYDGNTNVTLDTTGVTFKNNSHAGVAVTGVTVTANGAYSSSNAGAAVPVSFWGFVLGGTNAKNYDLDIDQSITNLGTSVTGEIKKRTVQVTVSPIGCDYGGTPTINYAVTGAVSGDDVKMEFAYSDPADATNTPIAVADLNAGTYTVTPSLTSAFAGNYEIQGTPTGSVTIAQKTVLASGVSLKSKEYDGTTTIPAGSLNAGYSISGLINGDTTANVELDIDISGCSFDTADVGYHGITVAIALKAPDGSSDESYKNYKLGSTSLDVGVYITPAPLTITGVTAQSKDYDGTNSATLTVTFSGKKQGIDDVVIKADGAFAGSDAGTGKTVNVYTYYLDGTTKGNYEIDASSRINSFATGVINKKNVSVIITSTKVKYGNIPEVAYTVSGAVAGDDVKMTLSFQRDGSTETVLKNVGMYTVTATLAGVYATNYAISGSNTGTAEIERATLTLSVNNRRVEYGQALPANSVTASGFMYQDGADSTLMAAINGGLTYEYSDSTGTNTVTPANVGEYRINIKFGTNLTLDVGDNYIINLSDTTYGKLVIFGMGGITVAINSDSLVYGTYDAGTYVIGYTVTAANGATLDLADLGIELEVQGTVKDAAEYKITYKVADATKFANYDITVADGVLTITKAALTVTGVTAAKKTYDGNSTVALTVAFSGKVGTDDVTITAEGAFADTKAGAGKTVNIYSYTLGGTAMGNYEIDAAGLLTSIATGEIEQKSVTVAIPAVTVTYGNVPNVTYTVTGAVAGEDVKLALAYLRTGSTETDLKNVGTYTVTATLDGDFATNYKISGGSATGTVTIERAVLTLTVNNQRYEYGATVDKPTVTVSGYKYDDATDTTVQAAINALTYRYYKGATVVTPAAVGEYVINVNYGGNATLPISANYVVNTADITAGKLVIYGMGGITVTVTSDTLVYGVYTSAYAIQSTISDNTLTLADLGIELYIDGTVKDVATYKMTYRVTDNVKFANYDVTVLDGILTITKAPLTITVGTNADRAYGTEASVITGAATATAAGLVYTDAFNKSEVTFTTNYVKFAGVGDYDVFASNWTNTVAKNYEITYVSGKVKITPYALTVTVDDKTSVYGDELEKLTYTGTPLNGDNLGIMLAVKPHAGETDVRNVGTYAITGEATNANYDVTVTDGTYTITKATLTAKPLDAEIAYGAALPHGVKISGYKYADESDKTLTSAIEGSALFHFEHFKYDETDNTVRVPVDSVTVEAGNTYYMVLSLTGTLETDNYKVIVEIDGSDPVVGEFTVFGKTLVVIISNVSAQYGKDVDLNAAGANYYKVTDLNGAEQTGISDLDITLTVYSDETTEADLNADGNYDVGKYLIIGSKNNNNYSIQFVSGNYTVYPYEVEVVWTKDGVDLAAGDVAVFTFEAGVKQGLGAYDKNDAAITLTVTDGEINAGVYYAGVSLPSANYIFKNAQDVTRRFEIKQLEIEVVWKAKAFATGAEITAVGGKFAIPYSAGNAQSPYPTFVLASDSTTAVNLTSGEYFVKGGAVEYGLNYVAEVMLPTGNYKLVGNATQYFDITKLAATINWSVGSATTVGSDNSCEYTYTGTAYVPTATSGEVDLNDNELHFTIFAVVGGVESSTPLGGAVSEVGTYRVYVSTSNNNYLIASANDHYDFEIAAQKVTVTWSSNSFTYNGLAQAPEAYFTYLTEIGNASSKVNVPLAVTVDGAHTDKGTYTAKITIPNANFVLSDGTAEEEYNYDITERNIEIKWTLNGTELTVVDDQDQDYDGDEVETSLTATLKDGAGITAANVPLKYSVTRRESATATAVDWTGKPIKDYGIYTLTVSLDKNSAAAANYKVVDGNWQITVNKVTGVQLNAENISYALNQLETEVPLKADVTGLVAGDKTDDGTELLDALINADKTIAFNWLVSSYVKGMPMGTFTDYADAITLNKNNTAVYTKLKDLLKNYEWTFTAGSYEVIYSGSDIFFYLMFDSKQSQSFVYDGSGRLPKAYYVKDGVTKELEVAYITDDGQVSADKPVNAGEYTVRVYKNPDENLPVKDLDGTLLDNYIEKRFKITKRDIYVNVSDGKEVYGNVSSQNLESKLSKLLVPDYVQGKVPAYANGVDGDRDDLQLKLISYKPADDANDILLNITENYVNVGEYYLVGDWDDQTFGANYTVTFEYANADHAVYTVEEASVYVKQNGTQWLEEWFDEAQQFDRYRSQFITLNKKTDGVYDNIVYQGNQSAAVKIEYSNRIYDLEGSAAIPEPEDEENNGYSDYLSPITQSGKFVINYKIEIANHETLFGKWTVLILPEGNFVKVLFVKEYTVSYGDEPLDREELVAALVDGGYLNISGMETDYFKSHAYAYVPMGNGRYADAKTNIGQYTITFELHDIDKNTEFEIMYREDIAEPDRNIGKYVVDRRLLTVEWGTTTFEYDGTAHLPEITISGWATSESVKLENLAGDDKHFAEVYDNGARTVITVSTYGNFTAAGEVHRVTIETDNPNYRIEAASASNAVSIRMPDAEPVIVNNGLPKWAWYVAGVAAAAVVLIIIILAAKLRKRTPEVAEGGGDDDGFYDDYKS